MSPASRPRLIAITGNIASGKTEVCNWFQNKGYKVYYADKIAHECLQDDFVKKQLLLKFGKQIFNKKMDIDREKLGKIVFSDKEKLKFLNNIVHPLVREKMQAIIDKSKEEMIIFEIPLLFESGLENSFDLTINISITPEKQIERLYQREGANKNEQQQRIGHQLSNDKKNEKSDLIIDNNSDKEDLYNQLHKIEKFMQRIPRKQVDRLS